VYSQSSKLLFENARVRLLLLLPHGALLSLWTYTAWGVKATIVSSRAQYMGNSMPNADHTWPNQY